MKNKIAIYGYGTLGKTYQYFLHFTEIVKIQDPGFSLRIDNISEFQGTIITVPAPTTDSGCVDISNVLNCLEQIPKTIPILIKSTISIDNWNEIKSLYPSHLITYSPEFLTESVPIGTLVNATRVVLSDTGFYNFWENIYRNAYRHFSDTPTHIYVMTAEEAITVKQFANAFLATKLSFFHEMKDYTDKHGFDFKIIKDAICNDSRIGHSHSMVLNESGWGGKCLPKDTKALLAYALKNQIELSVIESAYSSNFKR